MRRSARVTWDQVRVGVFILVAVGFLSLGIFLIGDVGNVFGDRYRLVTLMESAAGLVQGAGVQVAGQPVGQVDEIELIPPARRTPGGQAVAVWLAVDRSVREQIRADSRARVRTQGLLGDRIIDIEPGSPDAPVLQPGDTLRSAPSLNYQEVLDQASVAVGRLTELVANLGDVTESLLEGRGTAGQLLVDDALYHGLVDLSGSLADVLEQVGDGEGSLGRLLASDTLYERLLGSAVGLDTLTARLLAGEGTLGRLVVSDSLYTALTDLALRSDSLLAAVQEGEGSLGRLVADPELYEEMLRTVTDLNRILSELREDPRRYIPPVEVF